MLDRIRLRHWMPLVFATCTVFLFSCGDDTTGPGMNSSDPDSARAVVRRANTTLENILYAEINADPPDRPRDVDFRPALDLYQRALGFDVDNLDAHFGTAVTGLLVLSSDEEVNAAFDEWKTYLDNHTPFEVPPGPNRLLGVPIGLGTGREGLLLPFDLVPQSLVAQMRLPLLGADPQIGRIQDILRVRALPRLVDALGHLQRVGQNASYAFIVTPKMQGDLEADPAEIDQTDVLALRAACSLLASGCRIAISYQLGFAAYDSTNLVLNLRRGSGWLGLLPDGATQMGAARTSFLEATDDVDRALTALLAETDSQNDDVIKIGPHNLDAADVDSIRANLPNVRRALDTGYTRMEDWDDDSNTPEIPLTINLGNLFTDPVQDWKSLLPAYSISTQRRGRGFVGSDYVSGVDSIIVLVPQAGTWGGSLYSSVEFPGQGNFDYFYGEPFLQTPLTEVLYAHLPGFGGPNCPTDAWGQADFFGELGSGEQLIAVNWSWNRNLAETCVVIPVITWDAESFNAWEFPDPTLGGLLPQVTSTGQLFDIFGIRASQWEREWVLDWTRWW